MKIKAQNFFSELMTAISLMMDLDENRKLYHAWRVAILSERLARKILPEYKAHIFYAGLLHDIGAISLPDHVVHYTNMKDHLKNPILLHHSEKSAQIVKEIGPLFIAADMIRDHHEFWDGSGYPRGISGNNINLGGQILRICDTFDILARIKPPQDFKSMKTLLKARIGTEFSNLMYELMIVTLEEGDFFNKIMDEGNIPNLVIETMRQLPALDMSYCSCDPRRAVRVFARVIDAKHSYTAGHSERVATYTYRIAKKGLDLSERVSRDLEIAAYLHDAGKVAIPRSILDKPGPLTLDEFKLIKKHPVYTMEILSMVTELQDLVLIAGGHHEKYDGSGYPEGLAKDNIPLGARIMSIADAYDAMTSFRPYQKNRDFDEAKEVLLKNAGSQFDPEIVKDAIRVLP